MTLQQLLAKRFESGSRYGAGFGFASDYLKGVQDVSQMEAVRNLFKSNSINVDADLTTVKDRLTWTEKRNSMEVDASASLKKFKLPEGIEIPKSALMIFRNVVTTAEEDRDGDILLPGGAKVADPYPLLWQHVPSLPIGKMLTIDKHDEKVLRVISVLLDVGNGLGEDTAKLIEAGVMKISHGFIPLKFKEREEESKNVPWNGFEVSEYETMEHSTVSVPSNRGAIIDQWSRDGFKSAVMNSIGKSLFDSRPDKFWPGFSFDAKSVTQDEQTDETPETDLSEGKQTSDTNEGKAPEGDSESVGQGSAGNADSSKDSTGSDSQPAEGNSQDAQTEKNQDDSPSATFSVTVQRSVGDLSETITVNNGDSVEDVLKRLGVEPKDVTNVEIKGGRSISKANLAILREVVENLQELKSGEGLSKAETALLEKSIDKLETMIRSASGEDEDEGKGASNEPKSQSEADEVPFDSKLVEYILFSADEKGIERVRELLEARTDVDQSYKDGDEVRAMLAN